MDKKLIIIIIILILIILLLGYINIIYLSMCTNEESPYYVFVMQLFFAVILLDLLDKKKF